MSVLEGYSDETIDKILAGYMDADGSVGVVNQRGRVRLLSSLSQAASNDPDFELVRAFQSHYGLGCLYYYIPAGDNSSSAIQWSIGMKDTKSLFSRIGRHMVVNAQRFKYYIDIFNENRGSEVDLEAIRAKVPYGPLEPKGYPDYAWLAGYAAGDGHLEMGLIEDGYSRNKLLLIIPCSQEESLKYLQEYLGGKLYKRSDSKSHAWHRSLGSRSSSFSIPFLKNLQPYMLHKKKHETITKMLEHLQ